MVLDFHWTFFQHAEQKDRSHYNNEMKMWHCPDDVFGNGCQGNYHFSANAWCPEFRDDYITVDGALDHTKSGSYQMPLTGLHGSISNWVWKGIIAPEQTHNPTHSCQNMDHNLLFLQTCCFFSPSVFVNKLVSVSWLTALHSACKVQKIIPSLWQVVQNHWQHSVCTACFRLQWTQRGVSHKKREL